MDKIIFQDVDRTFTPEFQDGRLRCFYCPKIITQLKRHFGTHNDQIQDWGAMEEFCLKVSNMWRKEAVSKAKISIKKTEKAKETCYKYEKTEQGKNRKKEYENTDNAKKIRNKYEKTEQEMKRHMKYL